MKKLIIPILLLSICTTSCLKDKTQPVEVVEIDTLTYFPFEKILGIYSGIYELEEVGYYHATDDPDPSPPYSHLDTTSVSIEVIQMGLKTIAFLPDSLFITHPNSPDNDRNIYTIDSLVPTFSFSYSNSGYGYTLSAHFAGEELDSLYINSTRGWGESNDASESYTVIYQRFRLKKD